MSWSEKQQFSSKLTTGIHNFLRLPYHKEEIDKKLKENNYSLIQLDYTELNDHLQEHFHLNLLDGEFEVSLSIIEELINKEHKISLKIKDFPPNINIRELDATTNGKFISTTAMIKSITKVQVGLKTAVYECRSCMRLHSMDLSQDMTIIEPSLCKDCGGRSFKLLKEKSQYVNERYVKLEEPLENRIDGSTREFKAYMKDFLASPHHYLKAGDVCNISGKFNIIKDKKEDKWDFLIDLHNITPVNNDYEDTNLSKEEKKEIISLSEDPDLFDKMADSVAPNVYGYESIKKGIVLQLFEGSYPKDTGVFEREQIHILIIGAPGIGKSQLLKGVKQNAPKCISTSGAGSSQAGLTGATVRDELTGAWTIEAGAVVLANSGVLCIDEFDKLKDTEQVTLNEPMEDLTVSISKAGLMQTLSANTSIFAAANPKNGKFDRYKLLKKQLDMHESMLSRFDLIFALDDVIDVDKDTELARNILHRNIVNKEPPIEQKLFKKYITYAKKEINPILTEEVIELIVDFYVNTRQSALESDDGKPITARDIKGIERLAIAHAKLYLHEYVNERDVHEAIRLYSESLDTIGLNPETAGEIDNILSKKELNLIKYAEELIKEKKELYGNRLNNDMIDVIKADVNLEGKSSLGKYDVDTIVKKALINCHDEG